VRQGPKSLADREARAFLATQVAEVMQAGRGRGDNQGPGLSLRLLRTHAPQPGRWGQEASESAALLL